MLVTVDIPQAAVDLIQAAGQKPDTWATKTVFDAYLALIRADEEKAIDGERQLRITQKLGSAIAAWDPMTEVTLTAPVELV